MGRHKKYTEEERKEIARIKARDRYIPRLQRNNKTEHPAYDMYCNARKRAKEQGLPFDILLSDLVIPNLCPLLNIPLIKGIKSYTDNSPTLDKIIPSLGYIKNNIQIISMRANRIKDNASFHEFELIYNNWKQQRDLL